MRLTIDKMRRMEFQVQCKCSRINTKTGAACAMQEWKKTGIEEVEKM
jgi:hypothetical protein